MQCKIIDFQFVLAHLEEK